jgi:DNA repair protein RecO (recombination protein O)
MIHLRTLKTEALVIGSRRLGEADRVITLYTRERGRVAAVAKGIRRTRSKVGGRLEPFSLVHVLLYSGHGSLYTVTGADTIRTFQPVREALFRLQEGAHLLEAVARLFPEEEQNPAAFNLLVRSVAALAQAVDRRAAAQVVIAARLKLLLILGYLPGLDECVFCGSRERLCAFRPSQGGVLCSECFSADAHDCFEVDAEGLAAVRELLERPLVEVDQIEVGEAELLEVERILTQTLVHHGH